MDEEWRTIAQATFYQVSNLGSVRSVDRTVTWHRRNPETKLPETVRTRLPGKLLKPHPVTSGHLYVRVGGSAWVAVHILVLEAFVGPRPEGQYGRHLDDNTSRNCISNLAWGTPAENAADAIRNGHWPDGHKNYNAKLSVEDVAEIKRLGGSISSRKIAAKFKISHTTALAVLNGSRYRERAPCLS